MISVLGDVGKTLVFGSEADAGSIAGRFVAISPSGMPTRARAAAGAGRAVDPTPEPKGRRRRRPAGDPRARAPATRRSRPRMTPHHERRGRLEESAPAD